MVRKKPIKERKSRCRFCTKEGARPAFVDYKDVPTQEDAPAREDVQPQAQRQLRASAQ